MAQLLAGGIIVFGLVIMACAIFIVQREKAASVIPAKAAQEEIITALPISKDNNNTPLILHGDTSSPAWWREQLHSLTMQLQALRENAKDIERQIVILDEIATRATELEGLQRKHTALPEGKISLFPIKVHRQPTDVSYVTDKRPIVRKYTIKAM